MIFETWLRKQKHRNDPIGDLAKDFIYDAKIKYARDKIKIKLTRKYLSLNGACDNAIAAYWKAKKEFKLVLQTTTKTLYANEQKEES